MIVICVILLFACSAQPSAEEIEKAIAQTEAAKPTEIIAPTSTELPEATPTKEPTPTETTIPTETSTPTITVTPTPAYLFKDVFDGALNEGWEWIRENRFYWNLTDSPGNLTMFTYLGLINSPYFPKAQILLVREAPTGNFELTTKMNLIPSSNFQHAGLLIYQSDDNFVQLIRQYCDDEGAGCVGDGIYFDNQELGNFKGGYFPTKVKFGDSTYLKLTFEAGSISGQGKTYTAYFSVDGENWITIGKHDNVLTPIYVGLIANGGIEQKIPCHFDYFTIANIL